MAYFPNSKTTPVYSNEAYTLVKSALLNATDYLAGNTLFIALAHSAYETNGWTSNIFNDDLNIGNMIYTPAISTFCSKSNHMIDKTERYRKPLDIIALPENLKKNCQVFYVASGPSSEATGKNKYYFRYIACEYYPDEYVGRYLKE